MSTLQIDSCEIVICTVPNEKAPGGLWEQVEH